MPTTRLPAPGEGVGPPTPGITSARADGSDAARRELRLAWVAVALVPVGFVVAVLVGGAVLAALGYAEQEMPPLGVALAVALPLVLLALTPGVAAIVLGRRVVRAGVSAGWAPRVIGWLVVAYWSVTTVASIGLRLLE